MNYKNFTLGDWISHISGVIEDERELDGNEMRDLVEFLSRLPKWIPVSERLPESAGVYIVTREFTDGFECADLADACYFDGTSTWHDDNRINHGREYADKKIKAWMPLPKPYEPQEKRCADCNHYGKLSLDCGRCDDDCSMYEPQESEDKK